MFLFFFCVDCGAKAENLFKLFLQVKLLRKPKRTPVSVWQRNKQFRVEIDTRAPVDRKGGVICLGI